ncbi:MAG: helix-turn-helix transcriptional regulator [Kofleriaceae bacterium]
MELLSTPLREARTSAEFLADPIGRYYAGCAFVTWAYSPTLVGASYFGPVEREDHARLLEVFDLYRAPALAPPYRALIDGSSLTALDLQGYGLISEYLTRWREVAPRLDRLAIVQPPSSAGLANVVFAGVFHQTIAPQANAKLFESRADAFAWLDASEAEAAAIDSVLHTNHEPTLLRELRSYLRADLREANLDRAARALASSTRSLQRRLAELDTSFREELDRARAVSAKTLLLDSNLKIEAIALEVGCRSPSVLYDLFRRRVGESPLRFRARKRAMAMGTNAPANRETIPSRDSSPSL